MYGHRARTGRNGDGHPQSGFTLIELLIVIVILAILATIVVFAVQDLTSQSAVASCQSNFKTVETATETFKTEMGAYPGGSYLAGAVLTAADPPIPAQDNAGVLDLMGTSTTTNGTAGPWMKDYPYSGGHYQIEVQANGSGTISVYNTASPPTQIGSANTLADCAGVR